jgi:predicted nuclease of predicted toxin-antitoxin system
VKLLLDMNLSPRWVEWLARDGFEAIHWSTVGDPTDSDDLILAWAADHHRILITHDLDFSAILAASTGRSPSVVQLRAQDLLSEAGVSVLVRALRVHAEAIDEGALLSVDETGSRVRLLPL